jgi:p-aminobenzoyl-glutamate transporter AbgT
MLSNYSLIAVSHLLNCFISWLYTIKSIAPALSTANENQTLKNSESKLVSFD